MTKILTMPVTRYYLTCCNENIPLEFTLDVTGYFSIDVAWQRQRWVRNVTFKMISILSNDGECGSIRSGDAGWINSVEILLVVKEFLDF